MSTFIAGYTTVAIYLIIKLWPAALAVSQTQGTDVPPDTTISFLGAEWVPSVEELFLALVCVAGALGCGLHSATSLVNYVGNRRFDPHWTLYYIFQLPRSIVVALGIYFAIRAGLLNIASSGADLNPYGVVAFAGLAGLFAKQITDKLESAVEGRLGRPPPQPTSASSSVVLPGGVTEDDPSHSRG